MNSKSINADSTQSRKKRRGSTKELALQEARMLLQCYGFNGFSFQHVADRLGIRKPSLYDHFKTKEALAAELIEEYRESFEDWTKMIENFEPREKLSGFFDLFYHFSLQDGFCPMSALTNDYFSLSKANQKSLLQMYEEQTKWIKQVIREGQKKRHFRKDLSAQEMTCFVQSLSLGSQFSARLLKSPEYIRGIKDQTLKFLELVD